jgi:hypothetical protein
MNAMEEVQRNENKISQAWTCQISTIKIDEGFTDTLNGVKLKIWR